MPTSSTKKIDGALLAQPDEMADDPAFLEGSHFSEIVSINYVLVLLIMRSNDPIGTLYSVHGLSIANEIWSSVSVWSGPKTGSGSTPR